MKLITRLTLISCLSLGGQALAQTEGDQPSVSTTPLKGVLHLLQGRGGNVVASVGQDGVLIIDDDYPQFGAAYGRALDELADGSGVPKFVINTHWHGDHTGNNALWGGKGAVIVAHANVRNRMSTRQEMKALGRVVEPSPREALPVVTYGDRMALHFNDDSVELIHFARGHTDGDTVVYFNAPNVVHMGDLFFKDRFPFVDLGSGGNVDAYIANIAAILELVDETTVIIPGHGSVADRGDLQRYHKMLVTTTALVRSRLESGMPVAVITEQGLGEEWTSWGGGFISEDKWIATIAASVQGQ